MMRLQGSHLGKALSVALLLVATMAATPTRGAFINLTPTPGQANSATSVKSPRLKKRRDNTLNHNST